MLQIPFITKEDMLEATKLEHRKKFEEDRKKRIFHAKTRLYGVDVGALERQIADKNKRRQIQAECDRRLEEESHRRQHIIYGKQLDEEMQKRIDDANLNYYRCTHQRFDQRREFDLNDPTVRKRTPPMRVADDDIQLGISSAQVFSGEDIGHSERKLLMRVQQRAWLDQQMREKRDANESRELADRNMEESICSRDKKLEFMADSDQRMRQELIDRTAAYNQTLAEEKRAKETKYRLEKYQDDMAEIYNMVTSDMLTENPDVATSRIDPKKKIAIMYRGMNEEEMAQFREAQDRQKDMLRKRATDQKLMDKQFEQMVLNIDRQLMLKQRSLEREHQQYVDDQQLENFKLADLQRAQNEYRNNRRNVVSKDFFEQFNKHTR